MKDFRQIDRVLALWAKERESAEADRAALKQARAALERVAEWGDDMLGDWDVVAWDLGGLLLEEGLMYECPEPTDWDLPVPEIPYHLGDKWLRFIWQREGDR